MGSVPPPGSDVLVAVRPEAISIHPGAPALGPANAVPATAEQIIYRRALTHLFLRLDDGAPMPALHQNRTGKRALPDLAVGGRVTAHWTEKNNHPVSDS